MKYHFLKLSTATFENEIFILQKIPTDSTIGWDFFVVKNFDTTLFNVSSSELNQSAMMVENHEIFHVFSAFFFFEIYSPFFNGFR